MFPIIILVILLFQWRTPVKMCVVICVSFDLVDIPVPVHKAPPRLASVRMSVTQVRDTLLFKLIQLNREKQYKIISISAIH